MQHKETGQRLEELFLDWCNGKQLSPVELNALKASENYSEKMALYQSLNNHGEQQQANLDVPKWDISSTFTHHRSAQPSWWQHNGMSLLAMSFSAVLCVMLVLDVKVQWQDQGITLLTAAEQKQQWQQEQNEWIQQQVGLWAQHSQQQISDTLKTLETQQAESNVKLANYLLENTRTERQEDLQLVVNAMQQQRADDLKLIQTEIGDLQYKFKMAAYDPSNNQLISDVREPALITEE